MDTFDALRAMLGETAVLGTAEIATRSAGFLRPDTLVARALVRPRNTEEVSRAVRWCHDNHIAIVTHGGLTGLVHGADAAASEVILSMERMRAIEAIDPVQRIAVVQAGVTLQALQEAAERHGLQFALDLGARGSCTIGGNIADQRRRQPRDPLRHDARARTRPRGGARRRHVSRRSTAC